MVRNLTPAPTAQKYLETLVQICDAEIAFVASLNYDRIFEDECQRLKISIDLGLSDWNDRKLVKFKGRGLKFAKLHGSIDWFEDGDDIRIETNLSYLKRGIIFGGQSEKLVADGPYLQLRHEFERAMRNTNKLGIVGYSFQDTHLNTLIRIWASSRKKAKLVVLDPSEPLSISTNLSNFIAGYPSREIAVDVVQIHGTAKNAIDDFLLELNSEPDLSLKSRNVYGLRVIERH